MQKRKLGNSNLEVSLSRALLYAAIDASEYRSTVLASFGLQEFSASSFLFPFAEGKERRTHDFNRSDKRFGLGGSEN
jgi:hypothetical protein